MPHDAFLRCYVFVRSLRSWGAHVSILIMRVIPGRRSEAEASPESILPDLWLWIPGSRPAAEPRNDWTRFLPERASSVGGEASLASIPAAGQPRPGFNSPARDSTNVIKLLRIA